VYLGAVHVAPVAAEEPPVYGGSPKLLDRVRTELRLRHMSSRTEEAYVLLSAAHAAIRPAVGGVGGSRRAGR